MSIGLPSPRHRTLSTALTLLGTILLGSCSEGEDPAGVMRESTILLSLGPGLQEELVPDEARPIERIRVRAESVPEGLLLGSTVQSVDPEADTWIIDFNVTIPVGSTAVVTLSVELISLSTGTELVEWSGRTNAITLQVGVQTEVQNVSLAKGPLANLSVTGVAIAEPVPDIREGRTTQLAAQATTSTPENPPTLFWKSLNPGVATVSGSGLVEGVAPGLARIVATAGVHSDSVTVTVLPSPASVALEPEGVVLDALGQEVAFQATVLDPRGDPVPVDEVTWSVAEVQILEQVEGGLYRALARGATTVTATSVIDPSVSGSAEVVVRQVVAAVDVIPDSTWVLVGETLEFSAVALDANENVIEGMEFFWSTSNPLLAVMTPEGLATGLGVGTVSILAQALFGELGGGAAEASAPTPGTTGYATLEVFPEVARVSVLPNPFTFRSLDQIQAFTARAYGLDESGLPNRLLPLTDFTWSTDNPNVVFVDSTGVTADTAFARSLANGSTVLRATARGVTGSTPVFVTQSVTSVEVTPDPFTFVEAASGGYLPQDFTARAYDQSGRRIPGISFSWATDNGECFPIDSSSSTQATVSAQCGCGWESVISATASGRTGTAAVSTPACVLLVEACVLVPLPARSPFRLGVYDF
jgi:uncharacterized protein YjdB